MNNKYSCTVSDLFDMFADSLKPEDVLTSKLISQISSAITEERLKRGLNQSEFAQLIHVSQPLVSRWEHGEYNFSLKKLAEIAVKLNLDVSIDFSQNASSLSNSRDFDLSDTKAKIIAFTPRQETVFANTYCEELEEM